MGSPVVGRDGAVFSSCSASASTCAAAGFRGSVLAWCRCGVPCRGAARRFACWTRQTGTGPAADTHAHAAASLSRPGINHYTPLWDLAIGYLDLRVVFDDPDGRLKKGEATEHAPWKFDIKSHAAVYGFHPHGIIP